MSTGTSVKGDEDNARITVCLDEPRTSLKNDVDGNPDLFLAASLQFLHRLLAERRLQYANIDADGIPTSRLQPAELDNQQEGNTTARELYLEQIDQIEEYKRQLRSMENFLSTIQFEAQKPIRNSADRDAIRLNETKDVGHCGDPLNFESTELIDDSCGFIGQNPFLRTSAAHPHSFLDYDESRGDVPERKANDFASRLETHCVVPTRTSAKTDHVQSSSSYADIVRNAVSGLARNCGKKRKNRRNKHPANSWLSEARIEPSLEENKTQNGHQDSDIPKEIPLRVQLAMETEASPRKPVTLLVRVPNTVFNLLNRKMSDRDTKISSPDRLAETRTEPGKRKKKRITSAFRNLLKGRRTPSSTSVCSAEEKLPSHVTFALEETGIASCSTSIFALQENSSCDVLGETRSAELCFEDEKLTEESRDAEHSSVKLTFETPTKIVNGNEETPLNLSKRVISYETKLLNGRAAGTAWRKLANDKTQRTEVQSNKTGIVKGLTNCRDEKIIPLRCSEGSPQLGKRHGGISQRDVDTFLKLAAEMRKTQVYQDAKNKHFEIPVEIKTTEAPLRLRKTQKVSEDFLNHRFLHRETKISHETQNRIETQQFLEMLVGTLPEGAYFPKTEYSQLSDELPTVLDSGENPPQDNSQLLGTSEDSALEVLLRHIANDTSKPYADEEDTTVQTAPKRQLSKISVCYSSESLSGSDHETHEVCRLENSTVSQNEYRVNNHVLSNEPGKSGNQYPHHHETTEKHNAPSSLDDKITIYGKSGLTMGSPEVTKVEHSNLTISPFSIQAQKRLEPCSRTEVIIEEENCSTAETEVKTQVLMDSESGDSLSLSVRETDNGKTVFCQPVLSKQICRDRKELADAMMRWWGPQINYSTTPSSRTHLSAYSVSINNLYY